MILSDVGDGESVTNITVTLSDNAASLFRVRALCFLESFSRLITNQVMKCPAWWVPLPACYRAFNRESPSGRWSLYVVDDGPGDQGSLADGWSLTLSTASTTGAALRSAISPIKPPR